MASIVNSAKRQATTRVSSYTTPRPFQLTYPPQNHRIRQRFQDQHPKLIPQPIIRPKVRRGPPERAKVDVVGGEKVDGGDEGSGEGDEDEEDEDGYGEDEEEEDVWAVGDAFGEGGDGHLEGCCWGAGGGVAGYLSEGMRGQVDDDCLVKLLHRIMS